MYYDPYFSDPPPAPEVPMYEHTQTTPDRLQTAAAAKGCEVLYPQANELFLDCDSDDALRRSTELLAIFGRAYDIGYESMPSTTPGHWHIVVRIYEEWDLTPEKRLLFQALLGSDLKRELLAYLQADADEADPISVLYRPRAPALIGPEGF